MSIKIENLYWGGPVKTGKFVSMAYKTLRGARVLVTGGAGFIGSNLCESFLANGNTVVCFDNFSTGKRSNIGALPDKKGFDLFEGDIRIESDCRKAMKGIDVVLQQAALGSVPRSIHDPATTHAVNVNGFLNVLIAARDEKVNRFVYASSSSVYGDLDESPKVEDSTGEPLSPYAVTKIANEKYAKVFAGSYGMEIIGLRYFNVFGRHQDPEGQYAAAIPRFMKALLKGESPLVHGDGTASRDFTYVENVVQMNHLAATTRNRQAFGNVFNTGAGKSATLNELIAALKQALSVFDKRVTDIRPQYGSPRPGDIPHSLASVEKARSFLGYEPTHDLRQGLREAVKWYWENYR